MIRFDEAISIVLSSRCKHDAEQVSIEESVGRILAGDVYSDMDMPPFNKSAVDGYACRASDLDKPMKVLEVIAAGQVPEYEILAGTCSKLMTGGMLPEGADAVVMLEYTDRVDSNLVEISRSVAPWENVLKEDEDIKRRHGGTGRDQSVRVVLGVEVEEVVLFAQQSPERGCLADGLSEPAQGFQAGSKARPPGAAS